jgi:hypothetical protein
MRTIDRPAGGRARSHRHLAAAALIAVGVLLAPLAASPARAGWTAETPVQGTFLTRPAIAMDGDGHLGIAWQEISGEPGIRFATDAGGSWATELISTGDDWAPDVAYDTGGTAQVVFARFGAGSGIYLATKGVGSWSVSPLKLDASPGVPSVAVDAAGKLHVAYPSAGFTPGIWYLTNATGAWASTRVSTGTWDSEPSLALDPNGKVHIAFARYDRPSPGLFLATNAGGSWATVRLTTNATLDDYPALVIDAAGKRHVAAVRHFEDPPTGLLYVTDASGSWVTSQIGVPAGGSGAGIPAIGLDDSGKPEIVVSLDYLAAADDTLWRYSDLPWGSPERLLTGAERSEGFPDILRDASGRLTVAYRAAWHEPGIVLHRENPDEDTAIAPSAILGPPALATDPAGDLHLAFDRFATDASDGTSYVSDATGSWVDETIEGTHGNPDIGLTNLTWNGTRYESVRRIAIPDRLYSSTATGWETHPYLVSGGTDVSFSDDTWNWKLAYLVPGIGIRVMHDGLTEELTTSQGTDLAPDIVSGGAGGSEHYLVAFTRNGALLALHRYWSDPLLEVPLVIDSAPTWNPATMRPTVNSVTADFIAYDRGGSAAGIYLADDATYMGDWERSRISRAYADVTPAVASVDISDPFDPRGPHSNLYLAWARDCGGPSPGIYVATNRTGSWVTSQVVQSCDAYDPSISVLPDGRIVVTYLHDPIGIVVVTESATGTAMAAPAGVGTGLRPSTSGVDADGVRPALHEGLEPAAVGGIRVGGSSAMTAAQLEGRLPGADR